MSRYESTLTYGPVGDPNSKDPFERAQAVMPADWHVEGQYLYGHYFASRRRSNRLTSRNFVGARTPEGLVEAVRKGPWYRTWDDVRRAVTRR